MRPESSTAARPSTRSRPVARSTSTTAAYAPEANTSPELNLLWASTPPSEAASSATETPRRERARRAPATRLRPPSRPWRPSGLRTCRSRAALARVAPARRPPPPARRRARRRRSARTSSRAPARAGEEPVRDCTRPSGSTRTTALSQRPPARSMYMPTPMPTTRPSARASPRARLAGPRRQLERRVEAALEVARVVRPAHRGLVREGVGPDEVAPPQLDRVDAELARGQVDQALDQEGRLGPPRAAVRPGRHLVRRARRRPRRSPPECRRRRVISIAVVCGATAVVA